MIEKFFSSNALSSQEKYISSAYREYLIPRFSHKPMRRLSSVIQIIFDKAGEQALPCGNLPSNVHRFVSIVAAKLL